jgi:hypothetical protein
MTKPPSEAFVGSSLTKPALVWNDEKLAASALLGRQEGFRALVDAMSACALASPPARGVPKTVEALASLCHGNFESFRACRETLAKAGQALGPAASSGERFAAILSVTQRRKALRTPLERSGQLDTHEARGRLRQEVLDLAASWEARCVSAVSAAPEGPREEAGASFKARP